MSSTFKFTNEHIRTLPSNNPNSSSIDLEVSDSEISGLKGLSGKPGSKRFLFRYVFNSRKRSISLGRFPDIDVATARGAVKRYRALLAEGLDLKSELTADSTAPTVSQFFWDTYVPLQQRKKGHGIKTANDSETFWNLGSVILPGTNRTPYPADTAGSEYGLGGRSASK